MAPIGSLNFSGLASGLDTKAIIEAILRAERKPVERLELRQSRLGARQSALEELRAKLLAFRDTLRDLSSQRTFAGRTTALSQEGFLTASARPGAEVGLFAIEVLQLAAAHKVKSDGFFADDQGLVSDGTITIQSGDNDPITIEVSAANGNNSLEAVRDAINGAQAGVQASILFDGAEYRLIVRAEETGLANALAIADTTNLDLDDPANEVAAAADALLRVEGVEITSASNKLTRAIDGVTLNLLATTNGSPLTLQVEADVEGVIEGVRKLVQAYNEVIEFLAEQFDPDDPGPLGSDATSRRIQLRLQSLVTAGLAGVPVGAIRSLSSVGVSFDGRTGKMSLDTGRLQELLEERFDDVSRLFVASATATDPKVSFASSTIQTQAGDYAVQITQAAERATVVGSAPIQPSGLEQDETLTIAANGSSATVALAAGMDIAAVVNAVNAALREQGVEAFASDDDGSLRISTTRYGANQDLAVFSDLADRADGKQSGFDTTPATDTGADVAGTIDGVAASGAGQFLAAGEGTPAQGLKLRVTATSQDVTDRGGDFGTISFSPGLMQALMAELETTTRFGDGTIDRAEDRIEADLERIADEIERFEARLVAREAQLVRMFAEAERAIQALQAQQSALAGFLASF